MKTARGALLRGAMFLLIFSVLCGGAYTGAVTLAAQLIFPEKANGSIIEIDGKSYGSALLGQQFTDKSHMWGRIMNVDISTFSDQNGKPLMYAAPSNLSPVGEELNTLVAQRVERIRAANPEQTGPIPVELVTCSGSSLDPHISQEAAEYQVARLARENDMSREQVREIVKKATSGRLFGVLGENRVNVLEVNLMLEGILK